MDYLVLDATVRVPGKMKKSYFDPVTASSLVMTFWVIHHIRDRKIFFTMLTLWVFKDAGFYVDLKNSNLPW
jgi:hypothetical protein